MTLVKYFPEILVAKRDFLQSILRRVKKKDYIRLDPCNNFKSGEPDDILTKDQPRKQIFKFFPSRMAKKLPFWCQLPNIKEFDILPLLEF